jgi:hypothetical protein
MGNKIDSGRQMIRFPLKTALGGLEEDQESYKARA